MTSGWWMRSMLFAFAVLLIDSFGFRRILISSLPWPDVLPAQTRPALFVLVLVLAGAAAHVLWWTCCYYWQRRQRLSQRR